MWKIASVGRVNKNSLGRTLSLDVYLALYLKPAAKLAHRTMRARELQGNWISRRRNDKSNFRDSICTRERQNGRGTLIRCSVVDCPRNKRGALVLITCNCLRDQWLQPTNKPTKRPYYIRTPRLITRYVAIPQQSLSRSC